MAKQSRPETDSNIKRYLSLLSPADPLRKEIQLPPHSQTGLQRWLLPVARGVLVLVVVALVGFLAFLTLVQQRQLGDVQVEQAQQAERLVALEAADDTPDEQVLALEERIATLETELTRQAESDDTAMTLASLGSQVSDFSVRIATLEATVTALAGEELSILETPQPATGDTQTGNSDVGTETGDASDALNNADNDAGDPFSGITGVARAENTSGRVSVYDIPSLSGSPQALVIGGTALEVLAKVVVDDITWVQVRIRGEGTINQPVREGIEPAVNLASMSATGFVQSKDLTNWDQIVSQVDEITPSEAGLVAEDESGDVQNNP